MAFLPLPLGFLAWFGFVPLIAALDGAARESVAPAGGAADPDERPGWIHALAALISPAHLVRFIRRHRLLRRHLAIGYVFGLVFFLAGMHWIALLAEVAITVPWLKYPAWVAAAAYLACYPAIACGLTGWLARRARIAPSAAFPFVYLFVEELRASGELGFPWFQPGYTQHAYAPLIQMASLGSVTLVTLWLLVLNVLLWRTLANRSRTAALGAVFAMALPWLWGARALHAAPRSDGPAVALIQGNIAGELKWAGTHQDEILDTFVLMSEQAARDTLRPILLIWPETATGSYMRLRPEQEIRVRMLAQRTGVPVFAGYADAERGPDGQVLTYNAAGLFPVYGPPLPRYAKRHLVPFGERMPFEWAFPWLGKVNLGQAEWTPGKGTVLFPSAAGPFAPLICFEAIFPDLARDDVRRGAKWLVNVTNDEWFGNSAALYQHAAMSVFRAVENHVPLARCANTGLTLVTDSNGRVRARVPVFEPEVLVTRLSRPGPPTLFTRVGDWPGALAVTVVVALLAAPLLRRLTARGDAP